MGASSNFSFLAAQDERLARLGALAERYFFDDAPSTLIKLRQLAEFLAKEVAARHGLLPANNATFDEVLRTLRTRAALPREIADLLFNLKRLGNAAVHEDVGTSANALFALKIARSVAIIRSATIVSRSTLFMMRSPRSAVQQRWLPGSAAGIRRGTVELPGGGVLF